MSSRAALASARDEDSAWQQPERVSSASRRNVFIGVGVVVLLLLLFFVFHHGARKPMAETGQLPAASVPVPAAVPEPGSAPSPTSMEAPSAVAPGQKLWRVIAYTYNGRQKADAKAASINRRFPGFDAQVWSRTGQRPFLVELGNGMEKPQAFTLRARARHAGIARDVYAQNYAQ